MVIANAIKDNAAKYGWDINLFETVVVPISEWGPTLQKIRNDPPAVSPSPTGCRRTWRSS